MKKQTELLELDQKVNSHKVRTPYNRPSSGSIGKKFIGLSLTVPGQAMSVQTLLERHSKGLPLSVHQHTPLYDEDGVETSGISLKNLDLSELQQLREANKLDIKEYQRIIRQENDKRKKEQKDAEEAKFKEFMEKNSTKKETGKVDVSTNNP